MCCLLIIFNFIKKYYIVRFCVHFRNPTIANESCSALDLFQNKPSNVSEALIWIILFSIFFFHGLPCYEQVACFSYPQKLGRQTRPQSDENFQFLLHAKWESFLSTSELQWLWSLPNKVQGTQSYYRQFSDISPSKLYVSGENLSEHTFLTQTQNMHWSTMQYMTHTEYS